MSASIHYRKVSKSNKYLDVAAPSFFVTAMSKAFGNFPWRLTPSNLQILKGMAAAITDHPNPFEQLIDIIGDDNEIEVWPEY